LAYLWSSAKVVGNNDKAVSPYLKTWINQDIDGVDTTVCGVTGEGTSKEMSASWNSPFEGENIGSMAEKTAGLVQTTTDMTSITTLNSRQVWGGNMPTQFNIALQFYALTDPQTEVMDPLIALSKMMSPQVSESLPSPGSRIPGTVAINIGRNAIYQDCVIASISSPYDSEKNKDGLFVRAEVSLQIQTIQMLNRSEIASTFG
jgi:hypothetical protein